MWTNGATVVQSETWNPDGTVHDIHYYGLTGAYTDYDVVYANNKPVSATLLQRHDRGLELQRRRLAARARL